MAIKSALTTAIVTGNIFLSAITFAAPESLPPDFSINRDAWLEKLRASAPAMLCQGYTHDKGISKKMLAVKVDYDQCLELIPGIFDKCKESYNSVIPAVLKNESIGQWGSVFGNCMGTGFSTMLFDKMHPNQSDVMTKEVWLVKFSLAAPSLMCTELFKSQPVLEKLQAHQINYYNCVQLLPESISKCKSKLQSTIPSTLNEADRKKWGDSMGKCIGEEFRNQHLS